MAGSSIRRARRDGRRSAATCNDGNYLFALPGFPSLIFPNIAGRWEDTIHFIREGQAAKAAASLDVEQNLNVVSLVLQTDNADSETIVVYSIPQISLFVGRLTDLDIASNAAGDIVEIKSARRDPLQIDPLPARDAQASTTIT